MPIGSVTTPRASELLGRMHELSASHSAGQIDKSSARREMASLIGQLKASEDVRPKHLSLARDMLAGLGTQHSGVLGKLKQVVADLRGHSATFVKSELPQTRQEVAELKAAAELATLPYTNLLPDRLKNGMSQYVGMNLDVAMRGLADAKSQIRSSEDPGLRGNFVDPKSGMVATVVVDTDSRQVSVVFGGTTAGAFKSEEFGLRAKHNLRTTLSQWVSNVKTGLGLQTHSMTQAKALMAATAQLVRSDPNLQGYSLRAIGHSKGAAEAVYASLSLEQPVPVIGFSSADMGGRLARSLPPENLARAPELVRHFHVKADAVPNLRYATPSMRPLGSESVIPATNDASSPLGRHDQFAHHVQAWCDGQLQAYERGAQYSASPG